jgi:hypothetical protein
LIKARGYAALEAMRTRVGSLSRMELFYQGIFRDLAAAHGLKLPPLYPLPATGAANYGFLYALLRLLLETPCSRVLEIGVGQSTLMLDAAKKMRGNLEAVSIENDAVWARRIGEQVAHLIYHAPLVRKPLHGRQVMGFNLPAIEGRFDLMIVDGPKQVTRSSRWAALEVLDNYLADEFVVLFDDAGRAGDQDLMKEFVRSCGRSGLNSHFIHASRAQCLIFTPAFSACALF